MPVTPHPSTPRHRVSRRAVLGTVVWSAPVVTLATAAPAFAGSGATQELGLYFSAGGATDHVWVGIELSPQPGEGAAGGAVSPPVQFWLEVSDVWPEDVELGATRRDGSYVEDWEFYDVGGAPTDGDTHSTNGRVFGIRYRGGLVSGDPEAITYLGIEIRGYGESDVEVPAGSGTVSFIPASTLDLPWVTPEPRVVSVSPSVIG